MALVLLKTAGGLLLLNYGTHVAASQAFHEFCTPKTLWEVAQSLVTTASPVCSFLLSVMQTTQSNYAGVISTSLLTFVSNLL